VKIREPEDVGAIVEAPLLAADDHEAARDDQAARQRCWWERYPCARSAGRPTSALELPALSALALVAALCCALIAWDVVHSRQHRIEVRQARP
jgi:hypothetical protein